MNAPTAANPPFIKLRNKALSAKKLSIYSLQKKHQQSSSAIGKHNISLYNHKKSKLELLQQEYFDNFAGNSGLTMSNSINHQQKNIQLFKHFSSTIHQEMMDLFREEFQALRKLVLSNQYSKSILNNNTYNQINPVLRNPHQTQKAGNCSVNGQPYNSFTHTVNSVNRIIAKQKPQKFENPVSTNSSKYQKRQTLEFGAQKFYSQNPLDYVKSVQTINVADKKDPVRNQPFNATNPTSNLFSSVNQKQKIPKNALKEAHLSTPKKQIFFEKSTATVSHRHLSTDNNAQSFIQELNEEPMGQDTTYRQSKQFVRSFQKNGNKDQKIKETLAILDEMQNKDPPLSQALSLIYHDASMGHNLLVHNKLLFVRNLAN